MTFAPVVLIGADKDNYVISTQPTVNVVISAKPLTVTATASNKTYSATTTASVSGVTFDGLVSGETLSSGVDYSASGVFGSMDVGNDISVTVTVSLLSTAKSNNYTLSSGTAITTADITQKAITITGVTATGRAYDGTTPSHCRAALYRV